MKRIVSIILSLCMMATLLCAAVTFAHAASGDVFRISAQKRDGSLVELKSTSSYTEGWSYAMEKAVDHKWMNNNGYVRIVADLLADWNAVDGEFGSGDGFKWDTIFIEEEAIITLNLNGHTINRGLDSYKYNGEVISIDDDADVIINGGKDASDTKTGTIKGGFSCNGGGGIHVEEDVKLTLNNVNVVGNAVEDDMGSAIHILEGSTLTMNGGSVANNKLTMGFVLIAETKGTIYIEEAKATFNKVTFSDNICQDFYYEGAVVYLDDDSSATFNECIIENYGHNATNSDDGMYLPYSLFYSHDEESEITINKCTVRNNKVHIGVIVTNGKTVVNDSTFTGNDLNSGIFRIANTNKMTCEVTGCTFTDNPAPVNLINESAIQEDCIMVFTNCTFNNNGTKLGFAIMGDPRAEVKVVNCNLGDTVFRNKNNITIQGSGSGMNIGSVIGEGSLPMIVSFLALFISIGAIGAIVASNKKRFTSVSGFASDINEA